MDNFRNVERKKILFISPVVPSPNGIGIELRAWTHLEALATMADIDLIIAMTPVQLTYPIHLEEIRPLCISVSIIKLQPGSNNKTWFGNMPGLSALKKALFFYKSSFGSIVFESIDQNRELQNSYFDIVFCFRIKSYEVFEQFSRIINCQYSRLFVDFDDIESLSSRRELSYARKILGYEGSLIAIIEIIRTIILEYKIQRKANVISICSEVDRQNLLSRGCRASVLVIPNSYPCKSALPLRSSGSIVRLLFLGTMSYPPNEDAAVFFCEDILPYIRQSYPGKIELTIVGRTPTDRVLELAKDKSIVVTGSVDSVEPYYDKADLVIAPIRFGGGTRIKILEALSFGRAVVSTTIGAEGLELINGEHIAIADDARAFAEICIELLGNEEKRFNLAKSGREQVLVLYERNLIQNTLIKNIQEL